MKYRCRHISKYFKSLMFIGVAFSFLGATFFIPDYHFTLPEIKVVHTKTIKEHCFDIARRLDKIGYLSVPDTVFAEFIYKVAECESNHQINAVNGNQTGLWQHPVETVKKLKLLPANSLQNQADNYFTFLKAVGKDKIRGVKNSVDLHCYNFAPSRSKHGILSKVTNPGLKALDFNKDSLITREDLKIFQSKK